mgnify:CR=1 FL=1
MPPEKSGRSAALVAHLHGVQGVVCSNHIAPTISPQPSGRSRLGRPYPSPTSCRQRHGNCVAAVHLAYEEWSCMSVAQPRSPAKPGSYRSSPWPGAAEHRRHRRRPVQQPPASGRDRPADRRQAQPGTVRSRPAAHSSTRATTGSTWSSPITSCPSSTVSSSWRQLRALPHCVDVPIVVITVVDDRRVRYQALEAGATDFLMKPLDEHETRARCAEPARTAAAQDRALRPGRVLQYQVDKSVAEIHERELGDALQAGQGRRVPRPDDGQSPDADGAVLALIGTQRRPRRRSRARARVAVADARHRQDRHPRLDPAQAGAARPPKRMR